jgi:hypothetical protein
MNIDNKFQRRQVEEDREKACQREKEKDVQIRAHKKTRIWGKRKIKTDKT